MVIDISKRIYSSQVQELADGTEVVVAGWAARAKNLGKIAFIKLRDRTGEVQLTAFSDFARFKEIEKIPMESVLCAKGRVKPSELKSGAKEVLLDEFEIISKADVPLPIDFSGKVNTGLDKRLDNRFIDLRNPLRLAIFKVRSEITASLRNFLFSEGFIEMQTPKIIGAGAEGGATLFPVKYYDKNAYLSQSQQLYKQMMMAAGFEKVFEFGPSFRAEKSHTMRHLTEFTQFDFEMSFIKDEDDVLKVMERMFVQLIKDINKKCKKELELLNVELKVPKLPFPRVTHKEAIELLNSAGAKLPENADIGTEDEKKLGELVLKKYRSEAYFLTKMPYEIKPFYIMTDGPVSRGFDFEYRGEELASGGQREHRIDILVKQMREKGLNPDEFGFYLQAFRYGCPMHGGFGMGVDRLTKTILKLDNIREAVLFPRDPERVSP